MNILAMWVNPEHTTMEVSANGTSTYLVVTPEGELQGDSQVVDLVKPWLEAGNEPLPFRGDDNEL